MILPSVCILDEQSLRRDALVRALSGMGHALKGAWGEPSRFMSSFGAAGAQLGVIVSSGIPSDLGGMLEELIHRHPTVPIIVLASSRDSALLEQCARLGVAAFLDPDSTEVSGLSRALVSVLEGHHLYPSSVLDGLLTRTGSRDDLTSKLSPLSVRERQVLTYVAAGADNLKIASMLEIAERTVKAHVSSLYRKLGQGNRTQLALLARQLGVRPPRQV
jgi:two-component system, NarL family, nitrate/nitrite response regulator NarL